MDHTKILPIIEVYPCVQSEGSLIGRLNFIVRTTGCTHRCFFGEGGICDSWYTSFSPEKGKYTFQDVIRVFEQYPHIKAVMLTGGSVTMHMKLLNQLVNYCKSKDMFITLECEGSHIPETDLPIDLISFSPKFANSIPQIGWELPNGGIVDQQLINQHNKYRGNIEVYKATIHSGLDYHYKPVVDKNNPSWDEIEDLRIRLDIPKEKTFIMPAGDNREKLIENYPYVMDECIVRGYNFSGRDHIIAYNKQRLK